MIISREVFLKKYKELYLARTPYIATLAYWKMKHLIESGETYYLPEYGCYYMIRNKHLLIYYSPDHLMHISTDELNRLEAISLPAYVFDSLKSGLKGFRESRNWNLRYNFNYRPKNHGTSFYSTVNFDFAKEEHYEKAADLINQGTDWLNAGNIKRMTKYSAFDESLWFFVQDNVSKELIALSISEYNEEVKQTDLDWIYVSPGYHGKGVGRFLIEQTIERCKDKSNDICVGGTVDFYRKCGFDDYELWVWAAKDGYRFYAPIIQP